MGLAVSGAAVQGVLRNPLVSPYILGVSSGAAFGASLAIAFGFGFVGVGKYLVMTNAFIFAMLAMLLVYGIARLKGATPEVVILSGIAVGFLFSALVSILQYISEEEELRSIVFWLMGSLWDARLEYTLIICLVVFAGIISLLRYSWDLNTLAAGEEVAKSLGVNIGYIRFLSFFLASLITASIVSFTGVIGFVCLMAPHMSRIIIGSDHRFLFPVSAIIGAMLLLSADTAARTLVQPVEIPVGIMTSLIGVPFFLYLLLKRRRDFWA
jgi:iron complex transport system permease protein